METLFIDSYDEASGRHLILEEEDGQIWAYLLFPHKVKIEKSCFLASRGKISLTEFNLKKQKKKGAPPPLIMEFSNGKSQMPFLSENQIEINWLENGNVYLEIEGQPFLFFDLNEAKGFCKSIAKNGGYGNAWDEGLFQKMRKKTE